MAFSSARGHKGFVLKRFDFDSQLFRMSAIGKSSVTADDLFIYVKGSPEIMIDIFRKETIPPNYQDILKQYASQGFRVLAMGSRRIQANELGSQRLEL
jgi:cation-transporting ATPase 13A2